MPELEPMKIDERYQYLRRMQRRYRQADRATKQALLDEIVAHTGLHRKAVIRRLNSTLERQPRRQERGRTYGPEVDAALQLIWEALDYVCPTRLTPQLTVTAARLAAHGELIYPPTLQQQLATISGATVRRHLPALPPGERSRRRPTAPNRHQQEIPAYRIARDIGVPGHLELDLVLHCGGSAAGEFGYTLHGVDVATSWSVRRAILGRSFLVMADACYVLLAQFPFVLRELHPDNGSEFLNALLLHFLRAYYPDVQFSRSQPGCPNDNRLVEQKNATGVRRYLGDRRLDTVTQIRYLNHIYARLDRYTNYFLPVMHQLDKHWVAATAKQRGYLRRTHDLAQPPLDRLLATQSLTAADAQALQAAREALNPLHERRTLQAEFAQLFTYPNALPGHTESVFETLTHPELFPAARAALDLPEPTTPAAAPQKL